MVSFNKIAPEFHNFVKSYWEFRSEVDKVTDLAHVGELICDLAADYENLCSSFKDLESRFVGSSARDEDDVAVKTVSHKPRWVELVRPVKVLLHAVLS